MKARIMEQPARVYGDLDSSLPALTELPVGSEVELGGIKKKDGKTWVGVTLANGQRGYLPGDARIYSIKQAVLLQNSVNIYAVPSVQSAVIAQYKRNTKFYLIGVLKQDAKDWVRIRDLAGHEGFMEGSTRIRVMTQAAKATKALGRRNMLYGALWCIGGIVVTTATYSAASSGGGTYFVAWGAILFGGLQFLQGLYQYLTSPD